jgi:hypothetical protein
MTELPDQDDSQLVNDILGEINQPNNDPQQDSNEVMYSRQTDTEADLDASHGIPPESHANMEDIQNQILQEEQQMYAPPQTVGSEYLSGGINKLKQFAIVDFVKTVAIFMFIFLLLTNPTVQGLVSKVKFFSLAGEAPGLNISGHIILALLGGILLATTNLFV